MSTDSELRESEVGGAADASPVGERQQMLHQLIQSAQSNFIKLSHEPALLDDVYAQERARAPKRKMLVDEVIQLSADGLAAYARTEAEAAGGGRTFGAVRGRRRDGG